MPCQYIVDYLTTPPPIVLQDSLMPFAFPNLSRALCLPRPVEPRTRHKNGGQALNPSFLSTYYFLTPCALSLTPFLTCLSPCTCSLFVIRDRWFFVMRHVVPWFSIYSRGKFTVQDLPAVVTLNHGKLCWTEP